MSIRRDQLKTIIDEKLAVVEIVDLHTHLFSADFDGMLLWGIDEILTYHYLIAEYFRYSQMDYADFFQLPGISRPFGLAYAVLKRSPVSEAQRGY